MDINIKEKNSYSREMSVQIPWEELQKDFYKHVKYFNKKIQLPGFRPGKVPVKVLLKQFLPTIEADFIEHALNTYYLKALKEKELLPVNKAEVEKVDFHFEGDLSFTAKFEIEPDLILPKLKKKSLKVQKTTYIHDSVDVDYVIHDLQRNHSTMETVEDGADEGHFVLTDLQKLDQSGVPIIGKKLEKQYLKVGGGVIKDENLDRLKGAKAGDKIRMYLTVNEQGEKSEYDVSVINVEKEVLPEINEDFIKMVDPDASTEDEFRANVETRIKDNYKHRSLEAFERQLSDAMIELVNPEFPPSMVDSYLDHIVEDVKKSGQPGAENVDEAKVRETYQSVAERNLKWFMVRKALISQHDINVTQEEVEAEIQQLLARSPQHTQEIVKYYKKPSNRTRIEDDLFEKKILDCIQQFAKIKEVEVKTKDLRQQEVHDHD